MRRSERLSLWESWREAPERARTLIKTLSAAMARSDKKVCLSLHSGSILPGLPSPSPSVTLPGLRLPASASLPLASCWPRPQQLLPVSAAGGGRRRCSQRESHWHDGPGLSCPLGGHCGAKGRALLSPIGGAFPARPGRCCYQGTKETAAHQTVQRFRGRYLFYVSSESPDHGGRLIFRR